MEQGIFFSHIVIEKYLECVPQLLFLRKEEILNLASAVWMYYKEIWLYDSYFKSENWGCRGPAIQ